MRPVPRPAPRSSRSLRTAVVFVIGLLAFAVVGAGPALARARTIETSELLTAPKRYDGATITVEGELVGDYGFRRSGMMWTQLNDDSYVHAPVVEGGDLTGANAGIGLRIPVELTRGLSPPGGYRIRGPVVRATGVWKYHDPDRQGETYLAVSSIVVVENGIVLGEGPNGAAIAAGVVLLIAALGTLLGYVRRRDRT